MKSKWLPGGQRSGPGQAAADAGFARICPIYGVCRHNVKQSLDGVSHWSNQERSLTEESECLSGRSSIQWLQDTPNFDTRGA